MFCANFDQAAYVEVSCDAQGALVVVTRDELAHMSPFYLDASSAVEIVGAMLMVMAVAFVLRQTRKGLE